MTTPNGNGAVLEGGATVRQPVAERVAQLVLLAVAAYAGFSARGLGIWTPEGPGPGFFPLVLAVGLALLSVAWLVQTRHQVPAEEAEGHTLSRAAVVTFASLLVVAATLDYLGFQLVMTLFLVFHLRFRGRRRWLTSVVIALVAAVGTFHVFNDFLLVPLPYASVPPLTWLGI